MNATEIMEAINGISIHSSTDEEEISTRKGAWSYQEDFILINYIAVHGEGRWNYLARNSGLKRTGKSCRMRWKNYLRPNIRRGNFTPEEQLRIMKLHCCYGNRWSRIAQFLPGRTDNEIKNYWRTRVHKLAKQLNCDINSIEFREFIRNTWIPRLSLQIQFASTSYSSNESNQFDQHLTINSEGFVESNGPDPLQMDYRALSHPLQDHPDSGMELDVGGPDFGPQDYLVNYGIQEIDSPASWLNTEELPDALLRDYCFQLCP